MTKDDALIYWVMRYGTNGPPHTAYITDGLELDAFNVLTPTNDVTQKWWLTFQDGWVLNELGLQRLKEISNVEPT